MLGLICKLISIVIDMQITTEYILGMDMKISKTLDINLMKDLENVDKIWCVYSN